MAAKFSHKKAKTLTLMKTICTTVYTLDELNDAAKQKAHENWVRMNNENDDFRYYADGVIDDAKEIGKLMGIQIERVYYSGFCSQGDGACFVGHYSYVPRSLNAVIGYASNDKELHRIASDLQAIQKKHFYGLSANVSKHWHQYQHENTVTVDVTRRNGDEASDEASEAVTECLKSFMKWIYKQLQAESDYQDSFESFKDACEANDYTFTEQGKMKNA